MSKRLQVVVSDDEFGALRAAAESRHMTLSEWVRQSLRDAAASRSSKDADARIAGIRAAAAHEFPAPDIDQMLHEIEAGYLDGGA